MLLSLNLWFLCVLPYTLSFFYPSLRWLFLWVELVGGFFAGCMCCELAKLSPLLMFPPHKKKFRHDKWSVLPRCRYQILIISTIDINHNCVSFSRVVFLLISSPKATQRPNKRTLVKMPFCWWWWCFVWAARYSFFLWNASLLICCLLGVGVQLWVFVDLLLQWFSALHCRHYLTFFSHLPWDRLTLHVFSVEIRNSLRTTQQNRANPLESPESPGSPLFATLSAFADLIGFRVPGSYPVLGVSCFSDPILSVSVVDGLA